MFLITVNLNSTVYFEFSQKLINYVIKSLISYNIVDYYYKSTDFEAFKIKQ